MKEIDQRAESTFKELMTKNFPNLMKNIHLNFQEASGMFWPFFSPVQIYSFLRELEYDEYIISVILPLLVPPST